MNQWKDKSQFLGNTRLPTGLSKANNCVSMFTPGKRNFPHYYGKKVEKIVAEVPNKDCSNSPNTATKIKLQCSKFKWGYGSTFTYWEQKVRKINKIGITTIALEMFLSASNNINHKS